MRSHLSIRRRGTALRIAVLALTFTTAGALRAASSDSAIGVSTIIPAQCVIAAVSDIVFPTVIIQTTGQTYDAQGQVRVNCTNGAVFGISVPQGANDNGTQRRMVSGAGNFLLYDLYSSSGDRSAAGPLYPTASTSGPLGTGTDGDFLFFARIPVQATPPMGLYSDQLTVTVSY